jgi:hypothetical protein
LTPSSPQELPSARSLLRSTLIALAVAIALLITVVLPAEYGIDPTRIGRVLGLTQMGEIKVRLAREAAADAAADAAAIEAAEAEASATPDTSASR